MSMHNNSSYKFPFASYPAIRLALLIVLGILWSYIYSPSVQSLFIISSITLSVFILLEGVFRKKWPLFSTRVSILCYSLLIMLASCLHHQLNLISVEREINRSKLMNLYEWEQVEMKGRILSEGRSSSGRQVYEMRVTETFFGADLPWDNPYNIRLYGSDEFEREVSGGQHAHLIVRLYSFPDRRNPHDFDYGKWLHKRGITAHGEIVSITSVTDGSRFGWGPIRSKIQQNADLFFEENSSKMAKALLIGYKDDLSPETKQQFSRSGLSHIMAVSGLHVGFIVAPFWLLIPYLWGSQKGRVLGLFLLTAMLIGYAGLTGFSPSVNRASLMAWFLTYGKLFHKIRNSINLTAVAAIIVLLINPNQLFEVGFQLSFSAVFIILLIMPVAQQLIPYKIRYGFIGGLLSIMMVSVVVQLGLFPILITYFGEFSVIGPIANALVVPLLSFTVPAGLLFVLMSPIIPETMQAGVIPLQLSLDWVQWVAEYLGSQSFSYITITEKSASIFIIWITAIFWIASRQIPVLRWKFFIFFLIACNLFFIEKLIRQPAHKNLVITFLDVGQGDAIHVSTPNGKELLIDVGRWSPMSNSGESVLIPYFEDLGIDELDCVILSHPHADHIGGMPALLNQMKIGKIYQSDYEYDSVLYRTKMNLATEKGIPIVKPFAGDMIDIDPSIRLFVIGPDPESPRDRNPNNHSLSLKLVYGDTSFLFTGDAEVNQERQMAERYGDFLKSDLYKVGHHASNTSSTDIFMQFVEPDISVASLAFRNVFGHPGRNAVNRLHQYSGHREFTSLSGAIRYISDGDVIHEVTWR